MPHVTIKHLVVSSSLKKPAATLRRVSSNKYAGQNLKKKKKRLKVFILVSRFISKETCRTAGRQISVVAARKLCG